MIDAQSNLLTCRIPTLSGILFPGKPFTTEQCVYTIIPQIMPENQKAHGNEAWKAIIASSFSMLYIHV